VELETIWQGAGLLLGGRKILATHREPLEQPVTKCCLQSGILLPYSSKDLFKTNLYTDSRLAITYYFGKHYSHHWEIPKYCLSEYGKHWCDKTQLSINSKAVQNFDQYHTHCDTPHIQKWPFPYSSSVLSLLNILLSPESNTLQSQTKRGCNVNVTNPPNNQPTIQSVVIHLVTPKNCAE
jgi:hypothetical protein